MVSNFVGGLFNASDMKDNSGIVVAMGSFFNGVFGHRVLGTVDGVATAVTNPFGTIEGINNVVGDPGAAFSALKKEAGRIWDEELVNGSWEDRSRVAGAAVFEVVTTVAGMGAAKAAKAGDKAADLGKAAKVADAIDDAADAAKVVDAIDDVADAAKAAKVADAIDNVADTAKAARKAGKLSGALDRASDIGKASRAALSSIKKNASGMIDRALTSNTVKKAAKKADDFIRDVRNMLTPPELQPALVTGVLDDADDVGFFTKYYDDLVKKKKTSLSESGVKIEKAEIVGDAVDGAGDLGGVVKKGGGGIADKVIKNKFPDEPMPVDGKILDYTVENGKIKGINGINQVDFVITQDGDFIIGNKHHFLGQGQDVLAAGQLKINGQGQIKRIDNLSGHYRPTVSEAMKYPQLFEEMGFDLKKTWIELYDIEIDSSGLVENVIKSYTKMLGGK